MAIDAAINVFIGYDKRESVATDVAASSIRHRTRANVKITYLEQLKLRKAGQFLRPWLTDGPTGDLVDLIDGKRFTTEYSHTRFLTPLLCSFNGWAIYTDGDVIFLSDIKKLFDLRDERFAVMCVKHKQHPNQNTIHLNGRLKNQYRRKNWSSLMLINCAHPSNKALTKEFVNTTSGEDLHSFKWLSDYEIGEIGLEYNYISGISPKLSSNYTKAELPKSIHFTEGGPWNDSLDVQFSELWTSEYEAWCRDEDHGRKINEMPKTIYDRTA